MASDRARFRIDLPQSASQLRLPCRIALSGAVIWFAISSVACGSSGKLKVDAQSARHERDIAKVEAQSAQHERDAAIRERDTAVRETMRMEEITKRQADEIAELRAMITDCRAAVKEPMVTSIQECTARLDGTQKLMQSEVERARQDGALQILRNVVISLEPSTQKGWWYNTYYLTFNVTFGPTSHVFARIETKKEETALKKTLDMIPDLVSKIPK